jgi:hypothetical protein
MPYPTSLDVLLARLNLLESRVLSLENHPLVAFSVDSTLTDLQPNWTPRESSVAPKKRPSTRRTPRMPPGTG